ncbi:MAG: NUDIX hydrolase [Alphaproteobacteria bacterium]|nr:NUDIX hydrolase [Alphaproteobacteria bacterium]
MASYPNSGGPIVTRVPVGDNRERLVCDACGYVEYDNPKIVVGAVVRRGDRVLLCRRAINPRKGFWTLPAGFLELHESTEAGARREAFEEACAEIRIRALLAVYNIPRLSQVQLIYQADLLSEARPGEESLEVGLFTWDQVPWGQLAFPSVRWALHQEREVRGLAAFAPRGNPPEEDGRY